MDLYLTKLNGVLKPAYDEDVDKLAKLKTGVLVKCKITQKRNAKFHRKYMALLNIGFERFEPEVTEHKGLPVVKSFDRFRKDVVIATHRYDLVSNINGEVRAEAKSISFANMTEEEFADLYSDTINVFLLKIMRDQTEESIDSWVEQILRFD